MSELSANPAPSDGATGRAGAALAIIVCSQFMVGLDGTVVNIALPRIHAALHFSATSLAWVVNGYTMAFAGLLLFGGRLGDVLGRRRMFMAGLGLFALASLAGGLATDSGWLIGARVVQGVGAALAAPNSLALVTSNFAEGKQRDRAIAAVTASYAGSFVLGLIGGGMLTAWASWRWVLFINVPIAVLVFIGAPLFVKETPRHPGRFDVPGAIATTGAMACLVYGFLHAASNGWDNAGTLGTLIAGAVLLAAFAAIEARASRPIVPVRLLRSRNRSIGYANLFVMSGPLFAVNFFVTQYLQNNLGFSPLTAGLSFLPMAGALMAMAGITTQLLPRIGDRAVAVLGILMLIGGVFWLSRIGADSSYAAGLLGPELLLGAGPGAVFTAYNGVILHGVASEDSGSASSLLETMQWSGGSLGLSVMVTVFGTAARSAQLHHPASAAAGAGPLADYVLAHGMESVFTVSVAFMVLALLLTVFGLRARKPSTEQPREDDAAVPATGELRPVPVSGTD